MSLLFIEAHLATTRNEQLRVESVGMVEGFRQRFGLLGADGIHSTVRRLVFGPEARFLRYLGFHTAAFTFDAPQIHAATRGRACLTDTADRQMGFYGLRDGRVHLIGTYQPPTKISGSMTAAEISGRI